MSAAAREFGFSRSGRSRVPRKRELSEDQRREVKEAFDLFDTDKNGSIDYHELKVRAQFVGGGAGVGAGTDERCSPVGWAGSGWL